MFKHKEEAVSTIEQTADSDHDHKNVDNLLSASQAAWCQQEQELMKIKICYKICLIIRSFEQQYEVDY